MTRTPLPFDPIERGAELWGSHDYPDVPRMRAITSLMRVHQLVITEMDEAVKPFGLTFARYEVLVLLSFSRSGALPLGKIGERLQVHATSVTPLVQRLAAAGLIERQRHPDDGRAVLASLTEKGKRVLAEATEAITRAQFGLGALTQEQCGELSAILRNIRLAAGDF
ncbi:MarR family winged helix-turn-helix transcriptional regulator [Granulicoccus sp. GXG6511]|uniref:MarR family winged helix-turn-helix transcriptional regulator n=1 Tax=Granulicoccus sp. GXG6511 TaxID=3381351 RepID=UPI003D7E450B